MTCTTGPIAHQYMLAHESEPPIMVCTIGLGVNMYAQVLRSHEGWANNRESPMSWNHLLWSVRQGWHQTWIQGERAVWEVNILCSGLGWEH